MKKQNNALSGRNNERLKSHKQQNNQINAAWNNMQSLRLESNVSVPTLEGVEDSKDWVDNEHQM